MFSCKIEDEDQARFLKFRLLVDFNCMVFVLESQKEKMIEKKTAETIRSYLLSHHETIAVAESVTAGCLQRELSGIPEAEMFFQGGITTYNIGQKYKHLCVEPIHAKSCNCVSQQVAAQMALNALPLSMPIGG